MENDRNRGHAGDVWRGGGASTLSGSTVPNTHRYQGGTVAGTGNIITGITASGAPMTFTLNPVATVPPAVTSSVP